MTRKRVQKMTVGCTILVSRVQEIDSAAEQEGMNRAEWIAEAIAQKLGKRPRHTLKSRLSKVEKRLAALELVAAKN